MFLGGYCHNYALLLFLYFVPAFVYRAEAGDGISPSSSVAGRPPSHPGSRPGSFHSSRSQSLLSINSEQELAEYFEQSR